MPTAFTQIFVSSWHQAFWKLYDLEAVEGGLLFHLEAAPQQTQAITPESWKRTWGTARTFSVYIYILFTFYLHQATEKVWCKSYAFPCNIVLPFQIFPLQKVSRPPTFPVIKLSINRQSFCFTSKMWNKNVCKYVNPLFLRIKRSLKWPMQQEWKDWFGKTSSYYSHRWKKGIL